MSRATEFLNEFKISDLNDPKVKKGKGKTPTEPGTMRIRWGVIYGEAGGDKYWDKGELDFPMANMSDVEYINLFRTLYSPVSNGEPTPSRLPFPVSWDMLVFHLKAGKMHITTNYNKTAVIAFAPVSISATTLKTRAQDYFKVLDLL